MTVGLVVVSHSRKIAEGAVELAAQMAPDVRFYAVGGTDDGRIGTDLEKTITAFEAGLAEASGDGVVVLTDLGSAVMTAERAVEFSSEPEKVLLADAPLVEGLVAAAVATQGGALAAAVKAAAEAVRFGPEPVLDAEAPSIRRQGSTGGKRRVRTRKPDGNARPACGEDCRWTGRHGCRGNSKRRRWHIHYGTHEPRSRQGREAQGRGLGHRLIESRGVCQAVGGTGIRRDLTGRDLNAARGLGFRTAGDRGHRAAGSP